MATKPVLLKHTDPVTLPDTDEYVKKVTSKATVDEARQLAMRAALPAVVSARFAVGLACFSLILSCVALGLVLAK